MTLTEFLLARIAEDEAVARAVADLTGESNRWWVDGPAQESRKHWVYATGEKFKYREVADHIARHDPARVLAECEAKRRIVAALGDWDDGYVWSSSTGSRAEDALRALALPYADHPDFREEWRP